MTISEPLRIAVLSDIHLGHRRTLTAKIIESLETALPDNAETAALDVIFLSGDVFDDLITLNNDSVVWATEFWITKLLRMCAKYDIALRVLEGTPGHDWKQSKMFPKLKELTGIDVDLEYVDTLCIRHIERYGISVLYVPDEWDTSTENTLNQVRDLLRAQGLTKVDFAVMHGQFNFQLPAAAKAPKHQEQAYLELVKHLIFIGHDHTHKRFERIYVPGSIERLKHLEEGPKGHLRATVWPSGEYDIEFRENLNAQRYVTVQCQADLESTLRYLDDLTNELPPGSYIRVSGPIGHPIFYSTDELVRRWPLYHWSKDVCGEVVAETVIEDESVEFTPITITKDNISDLVLNRLEPLQLDPLVLEAAGLLLKELR